jgi:tetratricopeptide (TPR) repeat protein
MNTLNQSQKYLLAQFQLLPFTEFSAEELQVILDQNNEKELYKDLAHLSKRRLIVKKNKKFSPNEDKVLIINQLDDLTRNQLAIFIDFIQQHLSFDSNNLFKRKKTFSYLAVNYFHLFKFEWTPIEIKLLNNTLLYFYRVGDINEANLLSKKIEKLLRSDNESYKFSISFVKTIQLKNKGKYIDALAKLEENREYINSCTNRQFITQFYLYYFVLLRLNARQNQSMQLYEQAQKQLIKLEASQLLLDRLEFGKANIFIDINEPEKAIELLISVIENQLNYLDKLHPYMAESYISLGNAYHFAGNNELAIQYSLTALEILDFNYDTPSYEKASIHYTLASAYLNNDNYGLARETIENAINIVTELSQKYHPDLSIYRSVDILLNKWNYADPIKSMQEEFRKTKKYFPKNHSVIGFFHNNLAMLYSEEKEYEKSNKNLLAAYQINFNLFKKDTVNQAMLLSNMALNNEALGQYDEALGLLRRAENILVSNLGKNHQDIAKLYQAYAQVYTQMEDANKALSYLKKASSIIEYYNKEHPTLVAIYTNMSINFQNVGKFKKAKELILKAYSLYGAFYSEKTSFMEVKLLNTLATIARKIKDGTPKGEYSLKAYNKLKNVWNELLIEDDMLTVAFTTCDNLFYDEKLQESGQLAENLMNALHYSEMLNIRLDDKVVAAVYNSIAMNAAADSEIAIAINYMFRAVHILEKMHVTESHLYGYYSTLVELLNNSSYHKELAIPYIQKLLALERNKLDNGDPRIIVNFNRSLASIYVHLGKYDKAIRYYEHAVNQILAHEFLGHLQYTLYLEIAQVYMLNGMFDKSQDFNLKARHAYYLTTNRLAETEASISMQIANSYLNDSCYKEALEYAHSAEKLLSKSGSHILAKINSFSLLSGIYNDIGDKTKAQNYMNDAMENLKLSKVPENSVFFWMHNYRYARHLASNDNPIKALEICEKIIRSMNKVDYFNDLFIDINNFINEINENLSVFK